MDVKQVALRLEALDLPLYGGDLLIGSGQERVVIFTGIREKLKTEKTDSEVLLFLLITFNLQI